MISLLGRLATLFFLVPVLFLPGTASAATKVWNRYIDGPASGIDAAGRTAVAPDGSVYTVGFVSAGPGLGEDIWIRKTSPAGKRLWERTYDFEGLNDRAYGVAVAPSGAVYVVGYVSHLRESSVLTDLWLARYTPRGRRRWAVQLDGGVGMNDEGHAVTVATDGAIYVAGSGRASLDTFSSQGILLARYTPAGELAWSQVYGGGLSNKSAWGAAPAPLGGVYVCGQWDTTPIEGRGNDIGVWRFKRSGDLLWERLVSSEGDNGEQAWDVAAAPRGRFYVAGIIHTATHGKDIWLGRFYKDGSLLKVTTHDETGVYDSANAVAVDPAGGVWLAGSVTVAGGHSDAWIGEITARGKLAWETNWDGGTDGPDFAAGIAVGPDGGVYVSGAVTREGSPDIFIRKYR